MGGVHDPGLGTDWSTRLSIDLVAKGIIGIGIVGHTSEPRKQLHGAAASHRRWDVQVPLSA
jgi:hypothetical protein